MALRQSVGNLASALLSIVRTRLELFALEASGQKSNIALVLGLVLGALLCLALALLVFSVAVALYFWPTDHRYVALFVLALIYALVGGGLALWARRRLVHAPLPFSATLEELRHDLALIERLRGNDPDDTVGSKPGESP